MDFVDYFVVSGAKEHWLPLSGSEASPITRKNDW
jgi:hypothetical protein